MKSVSEEEYQAELKLRTEAQEKEAKENESVDITEADASAE